MYPRRRLLFARYAEECASDGDLLEPSIATLFLSMCIMHIDWPPIPDACGSHTPSAKATAHAASTAFPPFLSTSTPACVASGNADATMPPLAEYAAFLPYVGGENDDSTLPMSNYCGLPTPPSPPHAAPSCAARIRSPACRRAALFAAVSAPLRRNLVDDERE